MLVYALNDEVRSDLLAELCSGKGRMVNDLARRVGKTPNATSKYLKALITAGIVKRGTTGCTRWLSVFALRRERERLILVTACCGSSGKEPEESRDIGSFRYGVRLAIL